MNCSLRNASQMSKRLRLQAFATPFFSTSSTPTIAHSHPKSPNYPTCFHQQHSLLFNRCAFRRHHSVQRPSPFSTHRRLLASPSASATAEKPTKEKLQSESLTQPTQQSLLSFIKQKASNGAVRKISSTISETESGTGPWGIAAIYPDATTYRTAVRALLKAERTDLAMEVYRMRMMVREKRPEIGADMQLAANVIKAVQRDCKKRKMRALDSADVFKEIKRDCEVAREGGKEQDGLKRTVIALLAVMNTFLGEGNMEKVEDVFEMIRMVPAGPAVAMPVGEYNNAIRLLGKRRYLKGVFAILDLMRVSKVEADNETFEFLANAAVRQVEFVTGAVSMDTLPDPLGSEVAFVGRSNVGKSSLVNMICNRKALAYVSGRPGKTQQFNYFLVNGKDKESQFYMVDLPGVGYAKVPKHVQEVWLNFMGKYFAYRTSLRMIFHLVDGRHGALEDDEDLMKQMAVSGRRVDDYVIVLTKMDKMDKQKVKQAILDKTRAALVRNGCSANTPIVLTSATSRLGRDEMWRHLQAGLFAESRERSIKANR